MFEGLGGGNDIFLVGAETVESLFDFNSLGTNKKNIITSTQALKQAEESLKLARLRFQAGVGTQTDVIQAQTELARARGNRITAIVSYNRSLSILRTATVLRE